MHWLNKIFGECLHRHQWREAQAFGAMQMSLCGKKEIGFVTVIIGLQCACGERSLKYLTPPEYLGHGAVQPALDWCNHRPQKGNVLRLVSNREKK